MTVEKRGDRWRARFEHHGRTYSATFTRKKDAQEWERQELIRIERGTFVAPQSRQARVNDRLDDWLRRMSPEWRPRTLEVYRSRVDHHIRPFFGVWAIGSITQADVEDWRDSMPSKTAHSSLKVFKSFLNKQVQLGIIAVSPAKHVAQPKVGKFKPEILEPHELEAVVEELPRWAGDVAMGLVYLGCRVGDLAALTPASVDRVNNRIRIVDQKTGADRWLPIAEPLGPVIERRLAADTVRLFTKPEWMYLHPSGFRKVWTPVVERVTGKHVRPHDLRHTCASVLIRMGMTDVMVAKFMGHASPTITKSIYAHLFADDMEDMADALTEFFTRDRTNVTPLRKADANE